jgi:5-methylcytosine-specific restriction endonuclease McrA
MMCKKEPFWSKNSKDRWEQLIFNTEFLKNTLSEFSKLNCEYCGKENLKIYEWCHKSNVSDMATADHFYPKSKYEELKQNEKNLIVCCHDCNNKKKDDIWSLSEIKHPLKKSKISEIKSLEQYLLV